jgi:type I restriction-modification system DNA methylase subunit
MSEEEQKKLGTILWTIADRLRGSMNADDFRDYMLYKFGNFFFFLKANLF